MKVSKKLTFPKLDNEFVENILRQLVNQYNIIQIFFSKNPLSVFSHLIIHIEKNSDAQELQQRRWVKKVRNRYEIDVYFIYSVKFHHKFSLGHPFVEFYCQTSAVIYQNEELRDLPIITREWKKYKKKFHAFQERFYHDHDLNQSQVQHLISEGSTISIFTSYARLISYDLEYLETLYSGNTLSSLGLNERINNLIEYIPEIQKYFVKSSPSNYYLTNLLEKAKEATADDDLVCQNEMYEAVEIAEQNLYHLVERRLNELKKWLKKESVYVQKGGSQIDEKPKDAILETAIETIQNLVEVEQIYLYRQIYYAEKTTYYLMLISKGVGNEKLSIISQSLKSRMNEKYDFVFISHSRCWIQKNLYHTQRFFATIIQEKHLVYSSSPYHPEFHWEVPHHPFHADLYFHYTITMDTATQFIALAKNEDAHYQCADSLFALFFYSFCRTYHFVKTYYLLNYLSSYVLWQLCVCADGSLRQYEYLISQFWTALFPYVDQHLKLRHQRPRLDPSKVAQMTAIVSTLATVLERAVIGEGLLGGGAKNVAIR